MQSIKLYAVTVIAGMPVWVWALIGILGCLNEAVNRAKWTRAQTLIQIGASFALKFPLLGTILRNFPLLGDALRKCATPPGASLTVVAVAPEADTIPTSQFKRPSGHARIELLLGLSFLVMLVLALAGCPTTVGGKAALTGWEKCEVNQIPQEGQGVLLTVSDLLGGTNPTPALEQLGIQVGVSQVDCAVQALVSFLSTKLPAHGQPDPMTLTKIANGKAWLARTKAQHAHFYPPAWMLGISEGQLDQLRQSAPGAVASR